MLNFWQTTRLFSKAATLSYIPISSVWGLWFYHILHNTCYYLFDSSHPNECEMANSLSFSLRWWCAKLILYNIISFLKDSVWMMKRRIFMLLFSFFISFHPALLFTFSILRLVHSPLSFTSLLNVDCYCQITRIQ